MYRQQRSDQGRRSRKSTLIQDIRLTIVKIFVSLEFESKEV